MGICGSGYGFVDHRRAIGHRALDARFDHWHASEALAPLNAHIGRDDDGASALDHVGAKRLDTTGALGLHVDLDALICRRVLERFGCHVGMGNAGWA